MSTLKPSKSNLGLFTIFRSAVTPVGSPVTVGSPSAVLQEDAVHCFGGVELFSDAGGTTAATATAGTITLAVKTSVNPQGTDAVDGGTIDATALSTASWDSPTIGVTATPSGVTGAATHYRINVWQRSR